MDKAEYLQLLGLIEDQVKVLDKRKRELDAIYKKDSPYQPGDLVEITTIGDRKLTCYVGKVYVITGNFKYSFNQVRQDGDMSTRKQFEYFYTDIKLIKKGK
jgi:hypothetical protein